MRKLLILLLASVVALAAVAEDFDPLNADIEQNLTHPAVARKHSPAVKTGMSQLLRAIRALGFDASAVRDGEVVLVTIAASELFAPNAFTPKNAAITRLRPLMPYVKRSDNYKVIVAVHSDNTGDSFYNDSITVARADAIDDIMTRLNDGAETGVIPYGLGDDEPLAANISIEARRRNRRVEIYFVPTAGFIDKSRRRQN